MDPHDPDRFLSLVRAHQGALRRVARAHEAADERRRELEQEILLEIWRALPGFRGEASPRTWMLRVAHNVGIRHALRSGRAAEEPLEHEPDGQPPRAEEALDRQRQRARLYAALRRLSPVDRELAALHLEGLSTAEIAEVLGITPTNVTTRLSRVRARLTALLEDR